MLWSLFLSLTLLTASYKCASILEQPTSDDNGLILAQEQRGLQRGNDAREVLKAVSPNVITDTLFGRDIGHRGESSGPLDLHSEYTLRLHNFDNTLRESVILPNNFVLDLGNVKFNPSRDWGFHVGNWYVIRKMGNDNKGLFSRSTSPDKRTGSGTDSQFDELDDDADDKWFGQRDSTVTIEPEETEAENEYVGAGDTSAS